VYVHSGVFDESSNTIWLSTNLGVFGLDIAQQKLFKVDTEIDDFFLGFFVRDVSLQKERGELWLGTPKGALRINTSTREASLFTADGKSGSLPVPDVSTTFVDSAGNVWLGLEKEGLCVFRYTSESFLCLRAAVGGQHKLPMATVDDISEDRSGSLWLSMNQFGLFRITPDLEKFSNMRDHITTSAKGYFPYSFGGILRENNEIWLATDGGGINIFNHKTGEFKSLKYDPLKPGTLSSNSVISLTEDENGDIWAGTWAGGISKVDSKTLAIKRYQNTPNASVGESIAADNVFVVKADLKGGIWATIWGTGLQYLDIEKDKFTNFLPADKDDELWIKNSDISHLQLFDEKLWITGSKGLEVLDISTKEFRLLLPASNSGFTFVWVVNYEEIWIGTHRGLIRFNSILNETQLYTTDDGLADNEVSYIAKDLENRLWVATNNGLSVLLEGSNTFLSYTTHDGMVGNHMSAHGEFIQVENMLYVPSKSGMTIINPNNMPSNQYRPRTIINSIEVVDDSSFEFVAGKDGDNNEIPSNANSLNFEFTALSFVFPENNRFKYRLVGWQNDFVEVSANERFARYVNLPPGDYSFRVFSSNNRGLWDESGDTFSFTILPPWWQTWLAKTVFFAALMLLVFISYKLRFAHVLKKEKELQSKVNEKTTQLHSYAEKLKDTSNMLSHANSKLEERVERRTAELQLEINVRKEAESKLFHMAFHDALTNLPNRQWIIQLIESLLIRCKKEQNFSFGIMFLDGDRFKHVNDTLGHVTGDNLLKASSERLLSLLDDGQHAGRLGGDEFTVIAEHYDEAALETLAQRIVDEFKKPFTIDNHTLYFNVSMGIVKCDLTYCEVPEVLRNADIAMYRAKEQGRGHYQIFDEAMQKAAFELAVLEADLRIAVKQNQFHLVYQPIVDLSSGSISGFEALIRWHHPEKGMISPLTFIPIAEETGLIWDIGEWVLQEACKQTKQWHDMDFGFFVTMSVNLSTNQIRNGNFLATLDKVIQDTGIQAKYIKLELTESVLIENNHSLNTLYKALSDRQIDLAIDDFGTGYSSLAYLNEIPVEFLKIDRCFVEAIDKNGDSPINQDALQIVKGIISLGKSLRKKVVAEGIETPTQLGALIEFSCDFAQGYYLSRPLDVTAATKILENNKTLREGGVNVPLDEYKKEYKLRANRK
jgi:diguanylate cyclase (GGDEF)-like protein